METKFLRKKHVIRTVNPDGTFEDKHYFMAGLQIPSISAAKRAARELQEANGGMGRGSLKVVEDFPNAE